MYFNIEGSVWCHATFYFFELNYNINMRGDIK